MDIAFMFPRHRILAAEIAQLLHAHTSVAVGAIAAGLLLLLKPASRKSILAGRELDVDIDDTLATDWETCTAKCPHTGEKYLVFGCGFLGCRIVHALVTRGEKHVRAFDINTRRIGAMIATNPEFYRDVEVLSGDACDIRAVAHAASDITTVFATLASIRFQDGLLSLLPLTYDANVRTVETLLECALRGTSVRRIIYTSTALVTHPTGKAACPPLDETAAYVNFDTAMNNYASTKAIAEQRVIACSGLLNAAGKTILAAAVRPASALFGPQDGLITQKFLDAGCVVMHNENMILDYVYVDNVILAQLLLEAQLRQGNCGGEVFNITSYLPVRQYEFYDYLRCIAGGMPRIPVPNWIMWVMAYANHMLLSAIPRLHSSFGDASLVTPAMMRASGMDGYTFDASAAMQKLGYRPMYSLRQGLNHVIRERKAGRILMSSRDNK